MHYYKIKTLNIPHLPSPGYRYDAINDKLTFSNQTKRKIKERKRETSALIVDLHRHLERKQDTDRPEENKQVSKPGAYPETLIIRPFRLLQKTQLVVTAFVFRIRNDPTPA